MYKLFYSTAGFHKRVRNLSELKCGVFIQTDEPKPGSGIQLQVAPKSSTDKTLVFTQTPAAQPLGQLGRKYQSGLIQKTDLGNALQYAKLEPIRQVQAGQAGPDAWTKINCLNWSLSFADNLHVRGLMRNTDFTKLSNLMNQWTLMTLPLVLGAHPAAWFAWSQFKKRRAKKMEALKAAEAARAGHGHDGEHPGEHGLTRQHSGAASEATHGPDGAAHHADGEAPQQKTSAWHGAKNWLTGRRRKNPQQQQPSVDVHHQQSQGATSQGGVSSLGQTSMSESKYQPSETTDRTRTTMRQRIEEGLASEKGHPIRGR